jgi:hypothetical protein
MAEQFISACEETETSLLDILVILAQSWKLLLFGPFVAGVVAGGLSLVWPKTFESIAIVRMTEEEVALLHAAPVLDPLIEKFGLLAEVDGVLDDARQDLKKRLSFSVDRKTKLVTIAARARTPNAAQALGGSAITAMLKELQVKGQEKALIEKTIAINSRAIASDEDAIESIQRSLKRGGGSDLAQESAIKNLVVVNADIVKLSQENEVLLKKLEPKGLEVFVQEPSMPQLQVSPRVGGVVLSVAFASVFILLGFVFIRQAWRSVALNPESANKLTAIARSLGVERL